MCVFCKKIVFTILFIRTRLACFVIEVYSCGITRWRARVAPHDWHVLLLLDLRTGGLIRTIL